MKNHLSAFSIVLLLTIMFSCKKENLDEKLIGTWKYTSSIGGYAPTLTVTVNSQLKLTKTNFQFLRDGEIVEQGTYKITDEKSWNNDPRIIFEGREAAQKQFVKVSGNKLILFSGASIAADGVETHYIKVK